MKFKKKASISSTVLIIAAMVTIKASHAQEEILPEEIFSIGFQLGSGARAVAMGGAYSALGGDYSASLWNPAALADLRRVEFYGSFSHLSRDNTFTLNQNLDAFTPSAGLSEEGFTSLDNIGIAYPAPTYRGSLVFAFGYNRVKSYDSNFEFAAFNQTENDLVNQAWREHQSGGLNNWVLSGAVDVSPNTSLGLSLNFWTGGSEFQRTFREVDIDDRYVDYLESTLDNSLDTDITGFNVKLGLLHRFGNLLRVGVTAASPTTFKVEENWSQSETFISDDNSREDFFEEGFFDYKIRSPWTFTTGAAIKVSNLVVSGDLEFTDWSEIRYKSEPPIDTLTQVVANRMIRDQYGQTSHVDLSVFGLNADFNVPKPRVRLGAELTLPFMNMNLRGGYSKDPSIFKGAAEEDKEFYSGGIGLLLDRQVKLDLTYVYGEWKSFKSGLPDILDRNDVGETLENISINKIFITFSYRF